MPIARASGTERVLRISALGHRGDGIAETEEGRVFVPYALEGERVRARIHKNRAQIVEILETSPDRVAPNCRHFRTCGGCAIQHMEPAAAKRWKRGLIVTALRARGLDTPVEEVVDKHGAGRQRVTLHIRFAKGQALAGFMEARSNRLLDLDFCPVLEPNLAKVGEICRALATAINKNSKPFDILVTSTETGLDCAIRSRSDLDADALMEMAEIASKHDLARITHDGEMIIERRAPVMTFGKARVGVPPDAFLQSTKAGEKALSTIVADFTRGTEKVADLFCGIGPFALRLAETARIMAIDNDRRSITALKKATDTTQGLKPVTATVRDLFRNPVQAKELDRFDAIVFDPPRAGADAQAQEIAASKLKIVAAISCNPGTFARDAHILVENGYILEKVIPIDQFRFTAHVEIAALFRRR